MDTVWWIVILFVAVVLAVLLAIFLGWYLFYRSIQRYL